MVEIKENGGLSFFALTFALSIPFWAAGALTSRQLLPDLPISALGIVCPVLAAAILLYHKQGAAGPAALLKRSFDVGRIPAKIWLAPVILLEPVAKALAFGVIRLSGAPIPAPQISLLAALALFAVFFIAALGEELGWTGYATDPLQARFGALRASLILGTIWAVWHFIPLLEAHRSPGFIAWWSLGTITTRVIMVWLYNNTGKSVFAMAIYHAMINLTWQLFPVNGSYYDPRVSGLIGLAVAVFVIMVWGPVTFTRSKPAIIHQI